MCFKELVIFFITLFFCLSAQAGELKVEQQAAKIKGITLYNQHKAVSAEPYLRKAAEAGDRESQYYLAESLRFNSRYMTSEAQAWYVAAAEQGDYYAMFRLAGADNDDLCQTIGECPEKNKLSSHWSKMFLGKVEPLASSGDGEAMMLMYRWTGDIDWLKRSAEVNYAGAQYLLAVKYQEGKGVVFPPWDRSLVIEELYKKSADAGFPKSIGNYAGLMIEKGDLATARMLLKKAAETGMESSVYTYGSFLAHEPDEVGYKLDLVKGYGLVSLLLELDGGGGALYFAEEKLKQIEAKMLPEQIEEAKAFAKEWKATHPPLSFFPDKLGF
ncbi:sel1 repeat family protein [Ectopseudomonas mendocina]|uniref:Sel1 repeat family protein n=1 Tax=Ectopseudomonas mendocina TaxID=300 RepID=A0ABZ2RCI0_ECTME